MFGMEKIFGGQRPESDPEMIDKMQSMTPEQIRESIKSLEGMANDPDANVDIPTIDRKIAELKETLGKLEKDLG